MYQIAIGDSSNWVVLDGASIIAPFVRSTVFFSFGPEDRLSEKLEIKLSGTSTQISTAIVSLEKIVHLAISHSQGIHPSPQYLRFQCVPGGAYFYTPIDNIYLSSNPAGYITHQKGSMIIELSYTRPNYFDGEQAEIPVGIGPSAPTTNPVELQNHTNQIASVNNSVYIKPVNIESELPAPLRFMLTPTHATNRVKDILIGAYTHLSDYSLASFFYFADNMSGGTKTANAGAISGYYYRVQFTNTGWDYVMTFPITSNSMSLLSGQAYRPIFHFFTTPTYTDLLLKFQIQIGTKVLFESEPIYCAPNFGYAVFPPVKLPPNLLLGDELPSGASFVLYTQKLTAGTYTLDIDQVMLFPLTYASTFKGFFNISNADVFNYDVSKGLHNVIYSSTTTETVAHMLKGGPVFAVPGFYNRYFFLFPSDGNLIKIDQTIDLKVFYRPRKRLL